MTTRNFVAAGEAMTPVPTAFLANQLPNAPMEYIKVYLYGLYLANNAEARSTDMDASLHMTDSVVEEALNYWTNKGLMCKDGDGNYYYIFKGSATSQPVSVQEQHDSAPYPYVSFNLRINDILGRPTTNSELCTVYSWLEDYNFPQEVALKLIQHCISIKENRNLSFAYMDKTAAAWASKGVDSVEKAQDEIRDFTATRSGAKHILQEMGIYRRNPDRTELDLYEKWKNDWGFEQDAIEWAMKGHEFNVQAPFKYLDAILSTYHERNAHLASEINAIAQETHSERDDIKEILREAGITAPINREHERVYRTWKQQGFTLPMILKAAGKASTYANESKRLERADSILSNWKRRGLSTEDEVTEALAHEDEITKIVREVYDEAGIDATIGDHDRRVYERYLGAYGMNREVLLYAANLSFPQSNPRGYLSAMLQNWAKSGVKTVEQAQRAQEKFEQQKTAKKSSQPQQSYAQRAPASITDLRERARRSMQAMEANLGDS